MTDDKEIKEEIHMDTFESERERERERVSHIFIFFLYHYFSCYDECIVNIFCHYFSSFYLSLFDWKKLNVMQLTNLLYCFFLTIFFLLFCIFLST